MLTIWIDAANFLGDKVTITLIHLPMQRPSLRLQAAKLFTNSTKLRKAIPDGPLAIHGF